MRTTYVFHLYSCVIAYRHPLNQKATMSMERDENYVPRTRMDYKLPPASSAHVTDYHEIFEETPIYTLVRMLLMQALGMQFYLAKNSLGSPMYPDGANVRVLSRLVVAHLSDGWRIAFQPLVPAVQTA